MNEHDTKCEGRVTLRMGDADERQTCGCVERRLELRVAALEAALPCYWTHSPEAIAARLVACCLVVAIIAGLWLRR